jgi:hypothetical protein
MGTVRKLKDGEWRTKGGTVVTPEVEARWSEACEEDFHLAEFTRIQVGPSPVESPRVSEVIGVRVSPDLYDAARAKAVREGRSLANLGREALQRYVEE